MSMQLNIKSELNLSNIDVVSPEDIVKGFTDQIAQITEGLVSCVVAPYDGHIESYKTDFASALKGIGEHNIQDVLGAKGFVPARFEVSFISSLLTDYKFRVMLFECGVGGYPVKVALEQDIMRQLNLGRFGSETQTIQNREELESLMLALFSTKRAIEVIQGLINAAIIEKNRLEA